MSISKQLLDQAFNELVNLNPGEVFLVKDLFKGYQWKRYSISNRITLGSLFFHHANTTHSDIIKPLEKTKQKQQIYQKL